MAKEVGGFPCVSATHRGTGKRVAREDGAAHDCKKTAAQRLSTTPGLSRASSRSEVRAEGCWRRLQAHVRRGVRQQDYDTGLICHASPTRFARQ